MSSLERDGGLGGGEDTTAQGQPSLGQVGTVTPSHGGEPGDGDGMVEFGLDESWEEFAYATLDMKKSKEELVGTGQCRSVPGLDMETNLWGDQERSWEALADETVSILESQDQSYCQAGPSGNVKEDDNIEKEDDLGQNKVDLGQAETRKTSPGTLKNIVDGYPTPGGSNDRDCQGQDTLQRGEVGGTFVPEKLVTSTLLECGAAMDKYYGLPTTGQPTKGVPS